MLFRTTVELKTYCSTFNRNMEFATLAPAVELAETRYLLPLLGQAQYDALHTAYLANNLTAAQNALLRYVQRPLAYYVLHEAVPLLGATVSDMGVQESSSREGTSAPARQWSYNSLRDSAIQNADTFADTLLGFLEANHGTYPLWTASSAFTVSRELLINTAEQFDKHVGIQRSRRIYVALRPYIQLAEQMYLKPTLGPKLYDDLKAKLAAALTTPLSAAYAALLGKCQQALAFFALAEAMPFLAITVNGYGVQMSSSNDGLHQRTPADRQRYETAMTNTLRNGNSLLASLRLFLDDNLGDYPLYASDDLVTNTPTYELPVNRGRKSFMV